MKNNKTSKIKKLFLGITYSDRGIVPVDVYLVNPTDETFRVATRQGSFDGSGDQLLDLGYGKKPTFELKPNSFHLIDQMRDGGELDFMTYYNLYVTGENKEYQELFWQINGWSFMGRQEELNRRENLPVLNKPGIMLGGGD